MGCAAGIVIVRDAHVGAPLRGRPIIVSAAICNLKSCLHIYGGLLLSFTSLIKLFQHFIQTQCVIARLFGILAYICYRSQNLKLLGYAP